MRDGFSTFFSTLFSLIWTVLLFGSAIALGYYVTRELDVVAWSQWASLPAFLSVPLQRQGDNVIMTTLAGVIAGFLLLFLVGYVLQALWDALRLGWVTGGLKRQFKRLDAGKAAPLVEWKWFYYPLFTRLWREFAYSLHARIEMDASSGMETTRYHATLLPEMVFSQQALVDVPMRVEFFRHLPGILTGAGIVSTFAGILMGLTGFDPAVEIENVTRELQGLFMGVSTAFTASFFAIVIAILVTLVEKILVHWRYAQVAALQRGLNQRFGMAVQERVESPESSDEPEWSSRMTDFLTRMDSVLTLWQREQEEFKAFRSQVATWPEQAQRWQQESLAQLTGPVTTLVASVEAMTSRDAGLREQMQQVVERLTALDGTLSTHLPRQSTLMEGASVWQQDLSGQVTTLVKSLGQWLEQEGQSLEERRAGRDQLLAEMGDFRSRVEQTGERLQHEIGQVAARIPASQEIGQLVRAVALEVVTGSQKAHHQLTEQMQSVHQELLTRMAAAESATVAGSQKAHLQLAEQMQSDHQELLTRMAAAESVIVTGSQQAHDQLTEQMQSGHQELLTRMAAAESATETNSQQAHLQLAEQIQTDHQELLSRVDALDGGHGAKLQILTDGLLTAFNQRLDEVASLFQGRLEMLSSRIGQDQEAMENTLQAMRARMEQVAAADEEGMALLFSEVGQEMERLRRQVRDSAGRVVMQAQESLQNLTVGVAPERDAVWVERLLGHSTQQAEGVKQAVLGEVDAAARQLVSQMRELDQERARLQEVSAQEVMNVIAARLESAFGGLSKELVQMREQLVQTQHSMEQSLRDWVMLASKSTVEESKVLAKRIMEVQHHLDERHQGVIGVIDQLGQGLEKDLEQLRDGLYHKNEESSMHIEQHLQDLGQLLEGVVTSLGREQTVFIEMLGERLDSLRRRLKVK